MVVFLTAVMNFSDETSLQLSSTKSFSGDKILSLLSLSMHPGGQFLLPLLFMLLKFRAIRLRRIGDNFSSWYLGNWYHHHELHLP